MHLRGAQRCSRLLLALKCESEPELKAALCRSHTLTPVRHTFNDIYPTGDEMRRLETPYLQARYQAPGISQRAHIRMPTSMKLLASAIAAPRG